MRLSDRVMETVKSVYRKTLSSAMISPNCTCLLLSLINFSLILFFIPSLYPLLPNQNAKAFLKSTEVELHNNAESPTNEEISYNVQKKWTQLGFYGPFGFVRYSGYRAGPKEMVVMGFGASRLKDTRNFSDCRWTEASGSIINGSVDVIYDWDFHDCVYQTMKVRCRLESEARSTIGGKFTFTVDDMEVLGYTEKKDEVLKVGPPLSFKYNVTFCTSALWGDLNPDMLELWLKHHYLDYFDHFIVYNAGAITETVMEMLKPFVELGIVEIVPVEAIADFKIWAYAQTMFMNDCLYRNRFTSHWIAFQDLDEYLWVKGNDTFQDILKDNEGKSYISHGTFFWNVSKCQPPNGEGSVVERIAYRTKEEFCADGITYKRDLCPTYYGHRKVIVNPRLVNSMLIHEVAHEDINAKGNDISTHVLLHQHLRGLASLPSLSICTTTINQTDDALPDVYDHSISKRFEALRQRRLPTS